MRRAIRTFLSCLIMLAIPLQGFAAASMIFCGPHHVALAQRVDSVSAIEVDERGLDGFLKFFNFKCSACAACCTLSAMPVTPMPPLILLPSISVAVPFFGSSYAGIVPDGLERPPSQNLA